MAVLQKHVSLDGLLTFIVWKDDDGDISLGFDGFGWHTHADLLAGWTGLAEPEAVKRFVDDLLSNRAFIAVARIGDRIRDVWVSLDLTPDKYKPDEETIEFRYWNGMPATQPWDLTSKD